METRRVERIAEGELPDARLEPGERALATLVRKSVVAPARLVPADLSPVVDAYGVGGAVEIVSVLMSFHFINRVADLVGIRADLPLVQPRWAWLRRLGVRLEAAAVRLLIDLSNRPVEVDVDGTLRRAEGVLGPLPPGYAAVSEAPNVAGFLGTVAEVARRLDPDLVERVARGVAAALPSNEDEATGFHARPPDPVDALVFVGTRYPARTTDRMVEAVRAKTGWGDAELTDLFYAVSMRNAFERGDRLLAAPPGAAA